MDMVVIWKAHGSLKNNETTLVAETNDPWLADRIAEIYQEKHGGEIRIQLLNGRQFQKERGG